MLFRSAEAQAEHFPGAEIVADYRDLLDRDDIDAVDICTPTAFHAEMSMAFTRPAST